MLNGGPMQRCEPYVFSKAYPSICALECQKAIFPLGSSKSWSSRLQSEYNGLFKSHKEVSYDT